MEGVAAILGLVCGGLCVLVVIAVIVIVALGGSALSLLPFGAYIHARWFREEPKSEATHYSLDQTREAGVEKPRSGEEVSDSEGANVD